MNLPARLRTVFDTLTYRTATSTPDPADGLHITAGRWGGRTVHHPNIPQYLEARRRRVILDGLDQIDAALMDADTAELLHRTAVRMGIEQAAHQSATVVARQTAAERPNELLYAQS